MMAVIRNLILRHRLRKAANNAHQLMARCNHFGEKIEPPNCACAAVPRPGPSGAHLKELLKARRARANFFGAHLSVDPAWDILLVAYVALLDQEDLPVSTLLRTSLVPATTTLRWVKTLNRDGLLECTDDQLEDPRSLVKLSAAGKIGMERYLAAVWPSLPL